MKFPTLLRLLTIRNIKNEKFMTSLAIIGIALGIGLFIGVKVASDRALYSFESGIKGMHPKVNYEVFDLSGIDFKEKIYKDLLSIEERSFPVIKVKGLLKGKKETVDINGIDTVKSLRFSLILVRNLCLVFRASLKTSMELLSQESSQTGMHSIGMMCSQCQSMTKGTP
jgi:hypothetical protein